MQLGVITAEFARAFKLSMEGGEARLPGTDYSSLFSRPLQPAVVKWEKREGWGK